MSIGCHEKFFKSSKIRGTQMHACTWEGYLSNFSLFILNQETFHIGIITSANRFRTELKSPRKICNSLKNVEAFKSRLDGGMLFKTFYSDPVCQ